MALYNWTVMFPYYLLLSMSVNSGWPFQLISQSLGKYLACLRLLRGFNETTVYKGVGRVKGNQKSSEANVLIWGMKKQAEGVITGTLGKNCS